MRLSARVVMQCALSIALSAVCLGQTTVKSPFKVHGGAARFGTRPPTDVKTIPVSSSVGSLVFSAKTGEVVNGASWHATVSPGSVVDTDTVNNNQFVPPWLSQPNHSNMDGLNTVATFDRSFVAPAGGVANTEYHFTMMGNDPKLGGTTVIPTNIVSVSLQLLNPNGSVFQTISFAPYEQELLESPNFVPLNYRSGSNIQYADAVQRAAFFNIMQPDWHTLLVPKIVSHITFTIPYYANVQLSNGSIIQVQDYYTGPDADGSTSVAIMSSVFNAFFDNEVLNQINAGNFAVNGLNVIMMPNTYLFDFVESDPYNPDASCCTLGYHSYTLQSANPEYRWVTIFGSLIPPGIFPPTFLDVAGLSHEISEAIADPFNNVTPNWQFPEQPANSGYCQNDLEVGDPVEILSNPSNAIRVNNYKWSYTYHPQTMALYQWFEMGTTSSAIDGAYSFPNESVLTQSAIPCPQ